MKKLMTIITMAILLGSVAQADDINVKNEIINIANSNGWKVDTSVDKSDNKIYLIKKVKERIRYHRLRAEVSYTDNSIDVTTSSDITGYKKQFTRGSEIKKLQNALSKIG